MNNNLITFIGIISIVFFIIILELLVSAVDSNIITADSFMVIMLAISFTPPVIYAIVMYILHIKDKKRTEKENELRAQQNTDKANRTVKYLLEKTIGKELTDIAFAFDWKQLWEGEIEQKILKDKAYKTELYKKYLNATFDNKTVLKCNEILETKFYKNEYYQTSKYIMGKLRETYFEYHKLKEQLKEYENN